MRTTEKMECGVDMCCLQEMRWRGHGTCFMGVKERRYKFWWPENNKGTGGVGIMVKEELCEKVVKFEEKVTALWRWCQLLKVS